MWAPCHFGSFLEDFEKWAPRAGHAWTCLKQVMATPDSTCLKPAKPGSPPQISHCLRILDTLRAPRDPHIKKDHRWTVSGRLGSRVALLEPRPCQSPLFTLRAFSAFCFGIFCCQQIEDPHGHSRWLSTCPASGNGQDSLFCCMCLRPLQRYV